MTNTSLRSAATLGSPCSSSGLTASLPSLSCPDPALADTLAPDPLSLCDGHHPGAAPAVAPHPDVHLVEPAAIAPIQLLVCGGASKHRPQRVRAGPTGIWPTLNSPKLGVYNIIEFKNYKFKII